MAKLNRRINREELAKPDEFSVLPKGKYNTIVSETDYAIAKNGRESIELRFKVLDGEYANRIIFGSITTVQPLNPELPYDEAEKKKAQAEVIGQKNLNSLMMAVDMASFDDTDDFLNKKVTVEIKVTPAKGDYPERNDIVRYHEYEGDKLPSTSATQKAPAASAPKPNKRTAWPGSEKPSIKKPIEEDEAEEVFVEEEKAPGQRPW